MLKETTTPPKHRRTAYFVGLTLFDRLKGFADLEARIGALPTQQDRGDAFEVFAEAYLATQKLVGAEEVGKPMVLAKDNLADWSQRAKENSYLPDKTQSRHDIGADGCKADLKGDWSDDWQQPQKDHEGRGWQTPINKAADTYTTDKGSKRGD